MKNRCLMLEEALQRFLFAKISFVNRRNSKYYWHMLSENTRSLKEFSTSVGKQSLSS